MCNLIDSFSPSCHWTLAHPHSLSCPFSLNQSMTRAICWSNRCRSFALRHSQRWHRVQNISDRNHTVKERGSILTLVRDFIKLRSNNERTKWTHQENSKYDWLGGIIECYLKTIFVFIRKLLKCFYKLVSWIQLSY